MVSLYEQVEEHVRPWINIVDGIQSDDVKTSSSSTSSSSTISLQKLKQSLEKLLLEQN